MQTIKRFEIAAKTTTLLAIVALCLIGISSTKEAKSSNKSASTQFTEHESFKGNSEFFIKPEGDDRIWHVINSYSSGLSDDSQSLNDSYYIFSKDSVLVINKYIIDSENEKLNFALVGINTKQVNN